MAKHISGINMVLCFKRFDECWPEILENIHGKFSTGQFRRDYMIFSKNLQ
jgi:hypothetical protein